jgi:hypothetical protein
VICGRSVVFPGTLFSVLGNKIRTFKHDDIGFYDKYSGDNISFIIIIITLKINTIYNKLYRGGGHDHMVVRFTTTYEICLSPLM